MSTTAISAPRTARDPGPADTWAALVPLMARRMRVSRDGGRNYRRRDTRRVTGQLPNQPAAIHTYDEVGCAAVFCIDLDTARGDVDRDHARLTRLLDRVGARWFSDRSPNGGRHLYLPLAQPAPFAEARALARALAAQYPTLDPQPMLSIDAGCIRPPGARHKSGGHQLLDQPLAAAYDALRRPTPVEAWQRLLAAVEALTRPETAPEPDEAAPVDQVQLEALHGYSQPDETFVRIARTGDYPAERYRSPSEARQGVLWAAAAAGWSFADVVRRLEDGTWPGLASFYARYAAQHRHGALVRDWRNAIAFERSRRRRSQESAAGSKAVRLRTTSPHQTQRGAPGGRSVNREVRVWLAAVDFATRNEDLVTRAVLYALAEAAAVTGELIVEHGNRSLAIATGLDQSTVGRALRRLRSRPTDRLLVDTVRPAEGVRATCYRLIIPPLLRPAAERRPWRRGRIHAIRPVFRELGMVAAFVYAALEQHDEAVSGRELARSLHTGHTAVAEALQDLAAFGLATRTGTGWLLGTASPARLAEQFGIDEQVAAQIARYRAERIAWWRYLGLVDAEPGPAVATAPDPPPRWEDEAGLLELLGRELGAQLIA